VKGYAKQEQTVFTQVTEARAKATQMVLPDDILSNPKAFQQFEQNQSQLGGALGRLLAVSEAYPISKSSQNFLALQSATRRHGEPHLGCAPGLHRSRAAL